MNDDKPTTMTEAEFGELLDRCGADPTRWPPAMAERAADLLNRSTHARSQLDAARAVDAWLGGLRAHAAPDALAAAIMNRIERPGALERFLDWLTARLWRPVLVGALPIIAGFAIGIGMPAQPDADLAGDIGSLAFVDIYEELDDAEQP
jgi:hypothetical protein